MGLYGLVIPLGITTVALMIITASMGLKSKLIQTKIRLRIHKIMALATVLLALLHGSIVIYSTFFN